MNAVLSQKRIAAAQRPAIPRRGVIMLVALLALVLVTMVSATLVATATAARRELVRHERQLQARWLAESGLERSAVHLAADPAYTGEVWNIPAGALPRPGRVTIVIEKSAADPALRQATATAEYPIDAPLAARCVQSARFQIPGHPANRKEKS